MHCPLLTYYEKYAMDGRCYRDVRASTMYTFTGMLERERTTRHTQGHDMNDECSELTNIILEDAT